VRAERLHSYSLLLIGAPKQCHVIYASTTLRLPPPTSKDTIALTPFIAFVNGGFVICSDWNQLPTGTLTSHAHGSCSTRRWEAPPKGHADCLLPAREANLRHAIQANGRAPAARPGI